MRPREPPEVYQAWIRQALVLFVRVEALAQSQPFPQQTSSRLTLLDKSKKRSWT
jgi:hypothetical protein